MVVLWWFYGGSMVVLWWFYGGANARSALDIYYIYMFNSPALIMGGLFDLLCNT